jgi:general L-amino acid transport system substrate-binding protein
LLIFFATIIIAVLSLGGGILIVEINPRFRELAKKSILALWKRRALILSTALAVVLFAYVSLRQSVSLGSIDYSPTLKSIQDRGRLRCGVNVSLQGMGAFDEAVDDDEISANIRRVNNGDLPYYDLNPSEIHGLDVDFCRAVSAAIFGAEFGVDNWDAVYSSTSGRFETIRNGHADILFRNTSWTNERDFNQGVDFGIPYFYDQLAILINNKNGAINPSGNLKELFNGRRICVSKGTTSYDNMFLFKNNSSKDEINFELKTERFNQEEINSSSDAFDAFFGERGECDAIASDRSQIVSTLSTVDNSKDYYLMYGDNSNEVTAVELLSPVLPEGDYVWKSLVDNVIYTTIRAEELGISQKEVIDSTVSGIVSEEFLRPRENENYWKDLEIEGNDYPVVSIIKGVGNYGEIYNRNLGEIYQDHLNRIDVPSQFTVSSPEIYIQESRGPNRLLRDGGVLVSPPR